jgi:hypothetical protein
MYMAGQEGRVESPILTTTHAHCEGGENLLLLVFAIPLLCEFIFKGFAIHKPYMHLVLLQGSNRKRTKLFW